MNQKKSLWRLSLAVALAFFALSQGSLRADDAGKEAPKSKTSKTLDISKLPAPMDRKVDFAKDIKPILEKNCSDCHGDSSGSGGLRLDNRENVLKGGEGGPVIIPGKSEKSRLIHYVGYLVKGKEMPPSEPLKKEQIALLRAWIDQGAKWQ